MVTTARTNTLTQSLPVLAGSKERSSLVVMEAPRLSRVLNTVIVWALVVLVAVDIIGLHDHGHQHSHHRHHDHHHSGGKKLYISTWTSAGFLPGVEGALRRLQVSQPSGEPIGAEIVLNRTTITTKMTTHTDAGGATNNTSGSSSSGGGGGGSSSMKRGKRPFNPKWINPQDQLSPEYARVKKVACGLTKLSPAQTARIEALIVTATDLPLNLNPVIQCNKERLKRYNGKEDIGVRTSKDWNADKIKAQCQHADRWIEFEHCILSKLRNEQDYQIYQDTLRTAVDILSSA